MNSKFNLFHWEKRKKSRYRWDINHGIHLNNFGCFAKSLTRTHIQRVEYQTNIQFIWNGKTGNRNVYEYMGLNKIMGVGSSYRAVLTKYMTKGLIQRRSRSSKEIWDESKQFTRLMQDFQTKYYHILLSAKLFYVYLNNILSYSEKKTQQF